MKSFLKSNLFFFILGAVGLVVAQFLVDLVLFGDITPCQTFVKYEDGSSMIYCQVSK